MRRTGIATVMSMLLAGMLGAGIAGCDQGGQAQKTSRDQGRSEPPAKQSMAPTPPDAAMAPAVPDAARGNENTTTARPAEGSTAGQDSAWAGAATQAEEKAAQQQGGPMASPSDDQSKHAAKAKEPS